MCREALVPWLQERAGLEEAWGRRLLTDDAALDTYRDQHGTDDTLLRCRALDEALGGLTVLDPAVGSGAFLLGMLAELVRLRTLLWSQTHGQLPEQEEVRRWKLAIIERTLFGVDIEPLALELCRLRLWLSLVVDLSANAPVPPLPNLEYRTVPADSLTEVVAGIDLRATASAMQRLQAVQPLREIEPLRRAFFTTAEPEEKHRLSAELVRREDAVIEDLLAEAAQNAGADRVAHVATLRKRWTSQDRVRPIFMPVFHASEVAERGGWDIVILNPPYLGKKEVAQKVEPGRRQDYELHHHESNDLLVLFAYRARELVRPGGVCALIIQDSVFTSADATRLRRRLLAQDSLLCVARTKCFEGKAINGAVLVWRRSAPAADGVLRYVEGYKRDPRELPATQGPADGAGAEPALFGEGDSAGGNARPATEMFLTSRSLYSVVPSRPFFRPSEAAAGLLQRFRGIEPPEVRSGQRWDALSNTRDLERTIATLQRIGWFDRLRPGEFVPLGYCIVGGQGLATADDRYFLAAIDGTEEAQDCLRRRPALVQAIERHDSDQVRAAWARLRRREPDEGQALAALWEEMAWERTPLKGSVPWPRLLRVAPPEAVHSTPLTDLERERGIASGPHFVPFEKGDQSAEDEADRAIGAAWWRENPIVIDWSRPAVRLLRERAAGRETHRKPRIQNEDLWGRGGVTWNNVASYLRARLVPEGAIFGHVAHTIRPTVAWFDVDALLALLNGPIVDFILRTFLGSRMHIETGDIRRVPIPVLSPAHSAGLSTLGRDAVAAVQRGHRTAQRAAEQAVDAFVRDLYGVPQEADLWVVR